MCQVLKHISLNWCIQGEITETVIHSQNGMPFLGQDFKKILSMFRTKYIIDKINP